MTVLEPVAQRQNYPIAGLPSNAGGFLIEPSRQALESPISATRLAPAHCRVNKRLHIQGERAHHIVNWAAVCSLATDIVSLAAAHNPKFAAGEFELPLFIHWDF